MCSCHTEHHPLFLSLISPKFPNMCWKLLLSLSNPSRWDMNMDPAVPGSKFLHFSSYHLHSRSRTAITTAPRETLHQCSALPRRGHFTPECPQAWASLPDLPLDHTALPCSWPAPVSLYSPPCYSQAAIFLSRLSSLPWTTLLSTTSSLALLLHTPIFPSCFEKFLPLLC